MGLIKLELGQALPKFSSEILAVVALVRFGRKLCNCYIVIITERPRNKFVVRRDAGELLERRTLEEGCEAIGGATGDQTLAGAEWGSAALRRL